MEKRQVFFSFHYTPDNWRAAQVKNMGIVDGSSTWSANDWEEVRYKTDAKIKEWIDTQMAMRSCIVVLIGKETSSRKWVKYEIEKAFELRKGLVGVYIHGLKNHDGKQTKKGANPFNNIKNKNGYRLSNYVECYNPPYSTSSCIYDDIKKYLNYHIERAIDNIGNF
jgi:hypothetical protein